jgi:tetratricopeptide (TPR) repeat protein
MGRMLATCVLAASILAAGPAFDKKPKIWAQPLEERPMTMLDSAMGKDDTSFTKSEIDSFFAKWHYSNINTQDSSAADKTGIAVAPSIKSFLARWYSREHPAGLGDAIAPFRIAGSKRIMIEADTAETAAAYAHEYNRLVAAISGTIRERYGDRKKAYAVSEKKFMKGIWRIMSRDLEMSYEKGADMGALVRTGKFNCASSAFLAFDVANSLGIWTELVLVPEHEFAKVGNLCFETTTGCHYTLDYVYDTYPVVYDVTSDIEVALANIYWRKGAKLAKCGQHHQAILFYTLSIMGMTKHANACFKHDNRFLMDAYCNRGSEFLELGDYRLAIGDYGEAMKVELEPKNADLFNSRGVAHYNLGEYVLAVMDYSKAIELGSTDDATFYNNRALAYKKLGMMEEYRADSSIVNEYYDNDEW